MTTQKRFMSAALLLALLLPATGQAQDDKLVSSDDILKQLDKQPEPAVGNSRSFRGVRINAQDGAQPAPQAQQNAQAAEPSREVARTKESASVTLYIYFNSGSAELANDFSKKQVAAVGKALASPALANARFEIGGHTDALGSDVLNQKLSEQRAAHIRDILVKSYGLSEANVSAKGYGKSQPVASNDTDAGRAKNRRVVIKRLD